MVNTRKAFEKLPKQKAGYSSWMQYKIRKHSITDFRITYSKEDKRKLTFHLKEEDWEKIAKEIN